MYRVELDREACDGVFACLVRDDRFREAADGLATVAGADDPGGDRETATFAADRDAARAAAAACPLDAIAVTDADGTAGADPDPDPDPDPEVDG